MYSIKFLKKTSENLIIFKGNFFIYASFRTSSNCHVITKTVEDLPISSLLAKEGKRGVAQPTI